LPQEHAQLHLETQPVSNTGDPDVICGELPDVICGELPDVIDVFSVITSANVIVKSTLMSAATQQLFVAIKCQTCGELIAVSPHNLADEALRHTFKQQTLLQVVSLFDNATAAGISKRPPRGSNPRNPPCRGRRSH
jgi:hypothetical protein